MKIYTKTGDAGETGLFGGPRVAKDDARVEAYGAVDELNAVLGAARARGADADLGALLAAIQDQLFTLGAALATPPAAAKARAALPPLDPAWTAALEAAVDRLEGELAPLRHFVLPGGAPLAADLHVARAVCRRAERRVVALHHHEPVAAEVLAYLNRLSDFLFVAARAANRRAGVPEPIWDPRARR
ncbi:cob(I)yrinic acid a,c-diamide adenosyltransferase [Anaeromyxobacter diazotrophicus]|uniref:Corrinoid adenosyltransferase n=1 Tax=Anaeromyxobacter diazotrophicus TaxID=2590199 RepID=A0A7I9VG73_9BACT|nr:cob(I)yrinic acid a,c-diamide adenosyltransferase [Anaeromyxobacter diazotrophicus]GEJ55383.1 ATP--cob(I)alamin adenosyltransferase [Anaeromyxobacter diazotrophicus]